MPIAFTHDLDKNLPFGEAKSESSSDVNGTGLIQSKPTVYSAKVGMHP